MQGPEAASLLLDHRQSWERTLPSLSGFHPHGWHSDSLAPHSCSPGGWPKDSCLGAQAPVASDSKLLSSSSIWKASVDERMQNYSQDLGTGASSERHSEQTSQPLARWSHLSNRRIIFLHFGLFQMWNGWGSGELFGSWHLSCFCIADL